MQRLRPTLNVWRRRSTTITFLGSNGANQIGRKPKPNAIKRAEGNPGKRPIPEPTEEIRTKQTGPGEPPDWLTTDARAVWAELLEQTAHLDLYTRLDRYHLALFCQAVARNARAERKVAESAEVVRQGAQPIPNPWLSVINKTADQIAKLGSDLGVTPTSRAKLKATAQAAAPSPEEATSLEEFNE